MCVVDTSASAGVAFDVNGVLDSMQPAKKKVCVESPSTLGIVDWRTEINEACWEAMIRQADNAEIAAFVSTFWSGQTAADIISDLRGSTLEALTNWRDDSPSWIQKGEIPSSWMPFIATKVLSESV